MDVLSLLPTLASKQVTMATKSPSRSSSISSISSGKSPTHKSKTKASYLKEVWPESPFEAVITSVTEKGYVYGQPVTNSETSLVFNIVHLWVLRFGFSPILLYWDFFFLAIKIFTIV